MAESTPTIDNLYPHLTEEIIANLIGLDATKEQLKAADEHAKKSIDESLAKCQADLPVFTVMVIGISGSGKSATGNTLLLSNKFTKGTSTEPVTIFPQVESATFHGIRLDVIDTPGSWELKVPRAHPGPVDCYVIVINIACPRFNTATLDTLRNLKGIDGKSIIKSGRFVVAFSHADSALNQRSLEDYIREIDGDPLHTFLTEDAVGKYLALNNSAPTVYEWQRHQWALVTRMLVCVEQKSLLSMIPSYIYSILTLPTQFWSYLWRNEQKCTVTSTTEDGFDVVDAEKDMQ